MSDKIEIWKPAYRYGRYEVSTHGRIKSLITDKILKPGKSGNGYYTVALWNDNKATSELIQILVLEAFVSPRPPGKLGLHNDSNKANNYLSNLRWGTYSDNAQDQILNGTFNFSAGEKHQNAKLTNLQVLEIKRLLNNGNLSQSDIAKMFNQTSRNISKIKTGIRWKAVN